MTQQGKGWIMYEMFVNFWVVIFVSGLCMLKPLKT